MKEEALAPLAGGESTRLNVIALEMADGDPGYFVHGHVDKAEFIAAVNVEFGEEFGTEDAQHVYKTIVQPVRHEGRFDKPDWYGEADNYWWICTAEDEGAFAATFVRA
jgi:hypothetical protein